MNNGNNNNDASLQLKESNTACYESENVVESTNASLIPTTPASAVVVEEESSNDSVALSGYFPCMEQPVRVVFRQGNRFLSSTVQGKVLLTGKNQQRKSYREEFVILPVQQHPSNNNCRPSLTRSNVVLIQSFRFRRFLAVVTTATNPEDTAYQSVSGRLATIDDNNNENNIGEDKLSVVEDERAHWLLQREVGTGKVIITSLYNSQTLVIADDNNEGVALSSLDTATTSCWNVDSVTGELCYLSSNRVDQRLRCDMVGIVSLTDNWKGWEVWRLMESFDGYIRISSWMHSQFLLCCREDGTITTGGFVKSVNDASCDTEWAIASNGNGVTIRSRKYDRLLSVASDGKLCTIPFIDRVTESQGENGETAASLWQLEAAHRQRYTLSTKTTEQKDVTVGPFPFVTPNLRQSDEFVVEQRAPGIVAFRVDNSSENNRNSNSSTNPMDSSSMDSGDSGNVNGNDGCQQDYLCPTTEGAIVVRQNPCDGTELWAMETAAAGGYIFRSETYGYCLAYEEGVETNGKLVCSFANKGTASVMTPTDGDDENDIDLNPNNEDSFEQDRDSQPQQPHRIIVWNINPCMPRAVSSSKIKTFAIGTGLAIGTTVAMPFAMAGVMGVLGAFGAEVGLLANIVAVGLTGAEAIASVGVIGATAAICFRETSDSLSSKREGDDDDDDNDGVDEPSKRNRAFSQRPFCNWKMWKTTDG
ncbi:hypothetical protein ACA910_012159 [Epithemia clementina (nom. ined.)]